MVTLTTAEFHKLREAIAGAHMLMQSVLPLVKQRRIDLNKDQRGLVAAVPEAVAAGFVLVSQLTQQLNASGESGKRTPTRNLGDVDVNILRLELENVSALNLPDLEHEMQCVMRELPMYAEQLQHDAAPRDCAAKLTAWCWEGGRRYGLLQAIAIFENTTDDYTHGTKMALAVALDVSLDLPSPNMGVDVEPFDQFTGGSAETGRTDDEAGTGGPVAVAPPKPKVQSIH